MKTKIFAFIMFLLFVQFANSQPLTIDWQKCFGGTDFDQFSNLKLNDNYFILSGITHSNNGDVSFNHGSTDLWLLKMNYTGTLVWEKCFGGAGIDAGEIGLFTSANN